MVRKKGTGDKEKKEKEKEVEVEKAAEVVAEGGRDEKAAAEDSS